MKISIMLGRYKSFSISKSYGDTFKQLGNIATFIQDTYNYSLSAVKVTNGLIDMVTGFNEFYLQF